MYKVANGLSTNLFSEIFTKNEATNHFRSKSDFIIPKVRTELYGKCTVRYLGPVIWNTVPLQLKQIKSLNGFKNLIRNWKPNNCPCRLCKNYIPNLGFL